MSRERGRPRGHPTEQVVFRCPKELVEAAAALGKRSRSDALVVLLDQVVDARAAVGDLWAEVEVRAARDQCTDGEALGRIAREALERSKSKR